MIKDSIGEHAMTLSTDNNTYSIDNLSIALSSSKAYETLYRATDANNNTVVIKHIHKKTAPIDLIKAEIQMLDTISQLPTAENVIAILDTHEDQDYIDVVIPYYDCGTLSKFILDNNILNEKEAIEYFRQICYGIMCLHLCSISRNGVTADNIHIKINTNPFLNVKYYFSVADLGLTNLKEDTDPYELKDNTSSFAADIYSLGLIYYQMLTKQIFTDPQNIDILKIPSTFKKPLEAISIKILESCLQLELGKRIDMEDLSSMLCLNSLYSDQSEIDFIKFNAATNLSINLQEPINNIVLNDEAIRKKEIGIICYEEIKDDTIDNSSTNKEETSISMERMKYEQPKQLFANYDEWLQEYNALTRKGSKKTDSLLSADAGIMKMDMPTKKYSVYRRNTLICTFYKEYLVPLIEVGDEDKDRVIHTFILNAAVYNLQYALRVLHLEKHRNVKWIGFFMQPQIVIMRLICRFLMDYMSKKVI